MSINMRTILLVEDNPADVEFTREGLREIDAVDGLSVVTDGEAAIRYLRGEGEYADRKLPDLVVLDLNLPKKGGRAVLAEIKAEPTLRRIPVVVLSSSRCPEDVAASYGLHANCYIVKPPDLEGYVEVVKRIRRFWLDTVELPGGDAAA